MALNEQEEFELLSLEREKAISALKSSSGGETFGVTARPRVFNQDVTQPARMTNQAAGTRQVPVDSPMQRFLYEAGGQVTDKLSNAGLPPELAAGGGYLTNLAGQVGTTFLGGGAGAKLEPAAQGLGKILMQSALKPDKFSRDSGKAGQAIQTLLDEGINVTKAGAETLRGKVDLLQEEVMSVLSRYPNANVDKVMVLDALETSIVKTLKQGTPQDDIAILRKATVDFFSHPLLKDATAIPVQLAQEIKHGVWRKLGDKSFGKGLVPAAARDSQKAIGSGLKAGIEEVAPEVGPLNAKTQEFLNALKLVEKRSGVAGNRDIIGLGSLSPSMENFLVWMLDRYPAGKSMLARYFYTHADPEMAGRAVGAVAGSQSGKPPQ